ncbi:hypothetical protein GYMLUDRAFT_1004083, partial [Collybiopsis luxurians FD-317 M1]
YMTHLFIVFACTDGPRMEHFSGFVGHSGKQGCRFWCGLTGRHKHGSGIYYRVLAKPDNYILPRCDHWCPGRKS